MLRMRQRPFHAPTDIIVVRGIPTQVVHGRVRVPPAIIRPRATANTAFTAIFSTLSYVDAPC